MSSLRKIILVALGVWCLLLMVASWSTLWERDESRYGTAALEMSHSGNWLYPTFNHELRAFQPVMVYWLMSAGIRILGENAIAVRLASTLAMAIVCVLVGVLAAEFTRAGPLAAGLIGTTPMMLIIGGAATTDATLLLFTLLAQATFVHAWLHGPKKWHVPVMGLAIGLATLTKGPVGLAVPVLSIATILVLARGRSACGPFAAKLAMASLIGFLIFLAWGLPANSATDGDYWRIAIAERLPKRLFTAMEGHGGQGLIPFLAHLPFYPLVLAVGFLPWTLYLVLVPGTFSAAHPVNRGSEWARSPQGFKIILLGMTLPTVILMTLIVSKLPHYMAAVFPWLAILVAHSVRVSAEPHFQQRSQTRLKWAFLLTGVPVSLIAVALILVPKYFPILKGFQSPAMLIGGFLLVWLGVMAVLLKKARLQTILWTHMGLMVVWVLISAALLFPILENLVKPAQQLAMAVRPSLSPGTQVATLGWKEPGMHFYLGAPRISYFDDASGFEQWAAVPGPKLLIRKEPNESPIPAGFRLLETREGINPIHGDLLTLAAYSRE